MPNVRLAEPSARAGSPCHIRALRSAVFLVAALVAGCRQHAPAEPLPAYAWVDEATALRTMAERAKAIRTTSAECGLTLTRADGQSVQFDGAMVTRPPDRLRMQAIKFGRTVFDLALSPDGLYVKTMDDPARKEKILPASRSAARFAREWSMFTGGLFEQPDLTVQTPTAQQMIVRRSLSDGRQIVCEVDRPSLTPRRYKLFDPGGIQRFSLVLADYRPFPAGDAGTVVHPTRLTAVSEQGTIDIRLRDLEINGDPQPRAFTPPAGAEKLPE